MLPRLIIGLVASLAVAPLVAQSPAAEWHQWRGPSRDGRASAFKPPATWPANLTQRWRLDAGLGYATPIVAGDRVYQFARQGDNEVLMALDAATGKEIWKTPGYPAQFTMMAATKQHGPGPKSTPVLANGRLFTIGMTGVITAWDAASGKQLWQKPGNPNLLPTFTTHSFSPVVEGGLVIFHIGGHDSGALTAYDVNTGQERWSWKGDGPGYGSPVIAEIDGTRQVIAITQKMLVSLDATNGMLLWQRPWVSPNDTNSITPVVHGRNVIVSGNGEPTTAFTVTKKGSDWAVDTGWRNEEIPMRMSNPVLLGETLYGLSTRNSGQYFAVDARTGKTLWLSEGRQAANAAMATAPGFVMSLESDGELVVLRDSQKGFEEVGRYKVADTETWTQPSYVGNRIFIKDVSNLTLWTVG
jgi:outer membrane protein assembly factor BamB